jgi:membrane fusion protein, multidrug efflux system
MCRRIPLVKLFSLGKIRWFSRLGVVLLLLTAAGCGRHGKAAPTGGSDVPPSQTRLKRSVELDRATRQALTYYVETVGYLEAEGQTDIAAGVTGVVDEVLFREGQWVDTNTVLVKVDQRRYLAGAEVAHANAKRAEATLALAKDVAERSRRLAGRGVSDEEQSKAALSVRMADAELASARAGVILAEHNLERSQVRAPYAGQINQRKITPGTYLEEKTVIGTIADLRRLRLVGWVPEKAAPTARELMAQENRQRMGRMVANCLARTAPLGGFAGVALDAEVSTPSGFALEFTLMAYPKLPFHGRIFYLSSVANPDTHMFECKADVDTRGVDVELKPGFTARIKCPLHGNANACVIPEEAVRASERGFIAFVPAPRVGKDGQEEWVARARELKLGFRGQGTVEVLEGISPGEWLVRKGAESLEDGTPINLPENQIQQLKSSPN